LAVKWIDAYGDIDNDGFVEYRGSPSGLVNQGWKDSWDAVFHRDGSMAERPIALCEVQGYVYAAKMAAANLARALEHPETFKVLEREARDLRERFDRAFWCEEISTYALALDGAKRPCRVRTSNAGHALFTGIATERHARRAAETLMATDSFSGWGIRTVAATEKAYNPMSYHNGSVWPHDNAIIAGGLSRYGLTDGVMQILKGAYDAASFVESNRLPELFCGFSRRAAEGPTLYPVACSPQSWAAASVFAFLQATLGLSIRAPQAQLVLRHSRLPSLLPEMEIRNLRVGRGAVDLFLRRYEGGVSFRVRKHGSVEVITIR
jgi:glycogen debranching enzyme